MRSTVNRKSLRLLPPPPLAPECAERIIKRGRELAELGRLDEDRILLIRMNRDDCVEQHRVYHNCDVQAEGDSDEERDGT
jgi:hypothetical protein